MYSFRVVTMSVVFTAISIECLPCRRFSVICIELNFKKSNYCSLCFYLSAISVGNLVLRGKPIIDKGCLLGVLLRLIPAHVRNSGTCLKCSVSDTRKL